MISNGAGVKQYVQLLGRDLRACRRVAGLEQVDGQLSLEQLARREPVDDDHVGVPPGATSP